jgi:hypothetical protein
MLQRAEMVVAENLLQQGGQAFSRLILSNMNSCLHVLSTKQRRGFFGEHLNILAKTGGDAKVATGIG